MWFWKIGLAALFPVLPLEALRRHFEAGQNETEERMGLSVATTPFQGIKEEPGSAPSAAVYAKYLVPLFVALLLLVGLFIMYRRKRGIMGSRSRTASINESSDSEEEDRPREVEPEAFKPIPEEILQTTEALIGSREEEDPNPRQT